MSAILTKIVSDYGFIPFMNDSAIATVSYIVGTLIADGVEFLLDFITLRI